MDRKVRVECWVGVLDLVWLVGLIFSFYFLFLMLCM